MKYVMNWDKVYSTPSLPLKIEQVHEYLRKYMFCMTLEHNMDTYPEDFAFVCPPLGDQPAFGLVYKISTEVDYDEDDDEHRATVEASWVMSPAVMEAPEDPTPDFWLVSVSSAKGAGPEVQGFSIPGQGQ